jgi:hypothetical protein
MTSAARAAVAVGNARITNKAKVIFLTGNLPYPQRPTPNAHPRKTVFGWYLLILPGIFACEKGENRF